MILRYRIMSSRLLTAAGAYARQDSLFIAGRVIRSHDIRAGLFLRLLRTHIRKRRAE